MNATATRLLLTVFLLTAALGFGLGAKEVPVPPTTTIVIQDKGGFTQVISVVSEALMPAVVHIETTQAAPHPGPEYNYGPLQHQSQAPVQSLGSGVIISPEGYIITNNHVVEDAQSIDVELYGGTRRKATLVGRDPPTDLAVIKIDSAEGTAFAHFGDSDSLKVGEWVIAIGSPRGLDWTVTAGIVSAKHRTEIGANGPSGYEDFIQTDASINPGNSGGPLINLSGEVVGINSLIVSASQGSEGLGFAIPARMVKEISGALIAGGKVIRGYLGVDTQDLSPDIASGMNLPTSTHGAIVDQVDPAGPAAAAGIQQGDIVVGFSGAVVESATALRTLVASTRPGSAVRVSLLRKGAPLDLSAKVEDLETASVRLARAEEAGQLGLTVEDVTSELAHTIGMRRTTGVVVTAVAAGSAASRALLDPGDVILMIGDTEVPDQQGFTSLLAKAIHDGKVVLLIRDVRTGRVGFLQVPVSAGAR
jgi:serine protease Do